ncbi:MAG: MarR family transcriptional regulator [Sulfuriferula sp.]|nr:MarR family transcriptional regulator [Sulfuriferula sp.]
MVNQCLAVFEQRLDNVAEQLAGQPRQEVMLSRMQMMVTKKLQELMNHNLQPYGINDTIWTALVMIYSSTERYIFPSDLSYVLSSSRTHITRFADEMVAKGWLSRREHVEDRRKMILTLTEAGVALVEAVMPKQWAVYEAIWQDFSTAEKSQMETLQRKLLDKLSSFNAFPPADSTAVAMCALCTEIKR